MCRLLFVFTLLLTPGMALADNATDGGVAYVLVSYLTSIALTFSLVLALLFFGLTCVYYIKGLLDPNYSNTTGRLPVSASGLLIGILLCSLFVSPLVLVDFIGSVSGLTSSLGAPLCVAPNLDYMTTGYGWINNSASCVEDMKNNFAALLNYSGQEAVEVASLEVYLSLLQLMSVVGMLIGFVFVMQNVLGYRDVKVSKATAFTMIIVASTMFVIPNAVIFFEDMQASQGRVV